MVLFQNYLSYLIPLNIPINYWALIEIDLNLKINLGTTDTLKILSFPIHKHGLSVYLLRSSSKIYSIQYRGFCFSFF